jgi:hypothetical protein
VLAFAVRDLQHVAGGSNGAGDADAGAVERGDVGDAGDADEPDQLLQGARMLLGRA